MISGKNFGGYPDPSLKVTVGGEPCLRLHWLSDSLLVCLCIDRSNPPAAGASYEKGVSVSVGQQSTTYKDFEVIHFRKVMIHFER